MKIRRIYTVLNGDNYDATIDLLPGERIVHIETDGPKAWIIVAQDESP